MDQRLLQRFLADAQKNKKLYDENLKKLNSQIFEHQHGKNHISIKVNGKLEFLELKIADQLMTEKDMLEELIVEAINEIIKKIQAEKSNFDSQLMAPKF